MGGAGRRAHRRDPRALRRQRLRAGQGRRLSPLRTTGSAPSGCEQPNYPMPFADVTISGGAAPSGERFGHLQLRAPAVDGDDDARRPLRQGRRHVRRRHAQTVDLRRRPRPGHSARERTAPFPPGASAGDTHAARTGFYHLNRIKEHARAWLPAQRLAHAAAHRQRQHQPDLQRLLERRHGQLLPVRAAAAATPARSPASSCTSGATGWTRTTAAATTTPARPTPTSRRSWSTHISCIGRGFFSNDSNCSGYGNACLTCTGVRDQDWDKRASHAPSTPEGLHRGAARGGSGPCGKEVHCEGYLAGETLWDLAVRDLPAAGLDHATAWQLADKLWYKSRARLGRQRLRLRRARQLATAARATTWFTQLRVDRRRRRQPRERHAARRRDLRRVQPAQHRLRRGRATPRTRTRPPARRSRPPSSRRRRARARSRCPGPRSRARAPTRSCATTRAAERAIRSSRPSPPRPPPTPTTGWRTASRITTRSRRSARTRRAMVRCPAASPEPRSPVPAR